MALTYDPANPWSSPPAGREQPGLQALRSYVLARWGGIDAGIYADRAVRSGTTPSLHRDGRAWDWQQADRATFLAALTWLIVNADAIGIQRVIDYGASRVWTTGAGWAPFTGYGAGTLPNWHAEMTWEAALDTATIPERLAGSVVVPSVPTKGDDMILAPHVGTPRGRTACATVTGDNVLLWNGARVKGDVPFGTIRVWHPPTTRALIGIESRRDGKGLVVLANDGATFDAYWDGL